MTISSTRSICLVTLVALLPSCMNAKDETKPVSPTKNALAANKLLSDTVNSGTARFELTRTPADPPVAGNGIVDFNQGRSYLAVELPGDGPRAKLEVIFEGTNGFLVKDPALMAGTWWKRTWRPDIRPSSLHPHLNYLLNDPISVFGVVTLADMLPPDEGSGDQLQTIKGTATLNEPRVASLIPQVRLLASALVADGVQEVPLEITLGESGRIATLVLSRTDPESQRVTTYTYRFSEFGAELEVPEAKGDVKDISELQDGVESEEGSRRIDTAEGERETDPQESPDAQSRVSPR